MNRVYNFSAGPSMLPLEVLERAQKELVCYGNSGMSVMEMSHRSADFENILNAAKADLKELMKFHPVRHDPSESLCRIPQGRLHQDRSVGQEGN